MIKNIKEELLFMLLMVELYIITILFYEAGLVLPQNATLIFMSIIFICATFSFLSGVVASLYIGLFFVAIFGSYLLFTGIAYEIKYDFLYYVFLVIVPLVCLTVGSYSNYVKKTKQAVCDLQRRVDNYVTIDLATGLDNITAFNSGLMKSMSFSKRYNSNLFLLILEIKYYEELSTIYKVQEMQQIYKQVAIKLKQVTRLEDNKYRIADFTFAVILENISENGAESVKCKLRDELNEVAITRANGNIENLHLEFRIGYKKYGSEIESSAEFIYNTKGELIYDV